MGNLLHAPCRDAALRSCQPQCDALGDPYSAHIHLWRIWLLRICRRCASVRELSVPTKAPTWDSDSAHCAVHILLFAHALVLLANIDHCEHRPCLRTIYRTSRNRREGAKGCQEESESKGGRYRVPGKLVTRRCGP